MGKKHKKHKKRPAATEEPEAAEEEEKPLPKLVLKVTKEENNIEDSTASSDDHEKSGHKDKHKKKKKKDKKHKHKHEEGKKGKKRERSGKEDELEPPVKKIHIRVADLPREELSPERPREPILSSLQLCLENLHRTFQRKDVYGIFSYPVTDAIAPNYSRIIKTPMDFSTMMYKIENRQYPNLELFRDDFILMCSNAMTYNAPDTIYYKGAEKMLGYGMKCLSEDKVRRLKKSIGIVDEGILNSSEDRIIDEGSVVDVDSVVDEEIRRGDQERRKKDSKHRTKADILEAARIAEENIRKQNPNGKIGFLRKDDEGNTSLAILNPDIAGSQSFPVNLGSIAGKVQSGTVGLGGFKEDKKNKIIPVSYLVYGPYGSFGPTHDSSLSSLSKQESDHIIGAYGSEAGVHYAKSLKNFVKDASSFAQDLVDKFLDALTEGSHSKWLRHQEQKERKKLLEIKLVNQAIAKGKEKTNQAKEDQRTQEESDSNKQAVTKASPTSCDTLSKETTVTKDTKSDVDLSKIDFNSLMSLQNDGIDVSFLKDLALQVEEKQKQEEGKNEIHSKLESNATLLTGLKQAQNERLLKRPEARRTVSGKELSLAESLTNNFQQLLSKVQPKDVVSSEGVRAAMGIALLPDTSDDTDIMATSMNQEEVQTISQSETSSQNTSLMDVIEDSKKPLEKVASIGDT